MLVHPLMKASAGLFEALQHALKLVGVGPRRQVRRPGLRSIDQGQHICGNRGGE